MNHSFQQLLQELKQLSKLMKSRFGHANLTLMTGRFRHGKRTLLSQSGFEQWPLNHEDEASLYFNHQGMILCLGEDWLMNHQHLLHDSLKHISKSHFATVISGLIYCVDVHELLQEQFLESELKHHLLLMSRFSSALNKRLPMSIVLTKADAIPGFCDFFQAPFAEKPDDFLGFSIADGAPAQRQLEAKEHFEHLLMHLQQQVIAKMHQERSSVKRSLVREFPQHLCQLRAPLLSWLRQIPTTEWQVYAIFITSARQGGHVIDRLNQKISHEYALALKEPMPQANNFRTYFVQGALHASLKQQPSKSSLTVGHQPWIRQTVIAVALLALGVFSIETWSTRNVLDEISRELIASETMQQKESLGYHLNKAHLALKRIHHPTRKLQLLDAELIKESNRALKNHFVPELKQLLQQALNRPQNELSARFNALKTALMLQSHDKIDKTIVEQWFSEHWQQDQNDVLQKKLELLRTCIDRPDIDLQINQELIASVQNQLAAVPSAYLYYTLARDSIKTTGEKADIPGLILPVSYIPGYYTRQHFRQTLTDLKAKSGKIADDAWILNKTPDVNLDEAMTEAYIADYRSFWRQLGQKTQLSSFDTYAQGQQLLSALQKSKSIIKLIQLIQNNTAAIENETVYNDGIASQFTDINLITKSQLSLVNQNLSDLEQYMNTLAIVHDGGKTAFMLTKNRFMNPHAHDPLTNLYAQSQELPAPLNQLIGQIADSSFGMLVSDTRLYINLKWQAEVLPHYHQEIAKHYPFDPNSDKETDISHFQAFFSPNGYLQNFLKENIRPFLNTNSAKWLPKSVNNMMLPISKDMQQEIIRANVITNMFFPKQAPQPNVRFNLQKISLDPIIANFEFDMGNQQLIDSQNEDKGMNFSWPEINVHLAVNSIDGQHFEVNEQGIWALFKLFDKVNVLPDENDPTILHIVFDINGYSGRYIMKSASIMNPFIPGVLSSFYLNDDIV